MSAGVKSQLINTIIAILICIIIGTIDIITTSKFRMYPLYLIPIYLVLNYNKRFYLLIIIGISLVSMLLSEYIHDKTIEVHSFWNIFIILIMYYIFINIFTRVISEKKIIEAKNLELAKGLDEKSLLIRELYHRLKNNINSLISIITLQPRDENTDNTQEILNKLNVYSHLFEMLCYDKKTDEEINLYLYLKKLTDTLKESFNSNIPVNLKYSDVLIKNSYATSVGLIINELITNSVKYAAAGTDNEIKIEINFEKKQDTLTIFYYDNGKGFNYDEMMTDSETHFGLFLIKTLVDQHHGKLEYNNKQPEFKISLLLK